MNNFNEEREEIIKKYGAFEEDTITIEELEDELKAEKNGEYNGK